MTGKEELARVGTLTLYTKLPVSLGRILQNRVAGVRTGWRGLQAFPKNTLTKLRLSFPEPMSLFWTLKGFLGQNPGASLMGVLAALTLLVNFLASERLVLKAVFPETIGGPEAEAALLAQDLESQDQVLEGQAPLDSGLPDEFSGFYFVFEDSVAGWANPVSESLSWIPKREDIMVYEVQPGDTPATVARKFGISVETVLFSNNLNHGAILQRGEKLVVLPVSGILHEVKYGETLAALVQSYGVSESRILAVNTLDPAAPLEPGERIVIPGARPPTTTQGVITPESRLAAEVVGFLRAPTVGWNWGKLHRVNAVDIANACGTPVYAAASGFVSQARSNGWNGGYGNLIDINHENGVKTRYAHLSAILVSSGAYVNQGDLIGTIGNTGKTDGGNGCHLHFEVRGAKNPFARP